MTTAIDTPERIKNATLDEIGERIAAVKEQCRTLRQQKVESENRALALYREGEAGNAAATERALAESEHGRGIAAELHELHSEMAGLEDEVDYRS